MANLRNLTDSWISNALEKLLMTLVLLLLFTGLAYCLGRCVDKMAQIEFEKTSIARGLE